MAKQHPTIGIVGGLGPYGGLILHQRVLDLTPARIDQEHLPVVHIAFPAAVGDRTRFLLSGEGPNPAGQILPLIEKLASLGAQIAAIACNTAHAPEIFNPLQERVLQAGLGIELLHMIDEVTAYLQSQASGMKRLGIFSTMGIYRIGLYARALEKSGFTPVVLNEADHERLIHRSIYHPEWGIKSRANPISSQALYRLVEGMDLLAARDVDAVLLGCTELSLAMPFLSEHSLPLIDPTTILARALITRAVPDWEPRPQPVDEN